jgi:hypothetical protein
MDMDLDMLKFKIKSIIFGILSMQFSKNIFKKKGKTIDALVQKIQLDEHGKFRYYVMFATMDMLIYLPHIDTKHAYFWNQGAICS